jgi:hypothetical protein
LPIAPSAATHTNNSRVLGSNDIIRYYQIMFLHQA